MDHMTVIHKWLVLWITDGSPFKEEYLALFIFANLTFWHHNSIYMYNNYKNRITNIIFFFINCITLSTR